MSTHMKQALIEASWLLQAFIAALQTIRVAALYIYWGNGYQYLLFSLPPLLALIILYIVFLQLRLGYGTASKKQDLVFEAVKSGIATGLWLWFFIGAVVMLRYEAGALRLVLAVVGFVVPAVVFWPTLVVAFLAWRGGRTASISLS